MRFSLLFLQLFSPEWKPSALSMQLNQCSSHRRGGCKWSRSLTYRIAICGWQSNTSSGLSGLIIRNQKAKLRKLAGEYRDKALQIIGRAVGSPKAD
jgi:hypothetical protein